MFDQPTTVDYPPSSRRGTVLLEVLTALALFVAAAAIITAGLNASVESVERLRTNAHAADFAVSVLSELQMGLKQPDLGTVQPLDPPFDKWTWEAVSSSRGSGEAANCPSTKVEVVIRNGEKRSVYRLCEVIRIKPAATRPFEPVRGVSN